MTKQYKQTTPQAMGKDENMFMSKGYPLCLAFTYNARAAWFCLYAIQTNVVVVFGMCIVEY